MSRLSSLARQILASENPGCDLELARKLLSTDNVLDSWRPVDSEGAEKETETLETSDIGGTAIQPPTPTPSHEALEHLKLTLNPQIESTVKRKHFPWGLVVAFEEAFRETVSSTDDRPDDPSIDFIPLRTPTRPLVDTIFERIIQRYRFPKSKLASLPVLQGMPPERDEANEMRTKMEKMVAEFLDSIAKIDPSLLNDEGSDKVEAEKEDDDLKPGSVVTEPVPTTTETTTSTLLLRTFLSHLTTNSILLLLGFRLTTGSATDILPPTLDLLLSSFLHPHSESRSPRDTKPKPPESLPTVGSIALSKHSHRDSAGFWTKHGAYTGSTLQKNVLACKVLAEILGRPGWLNVHQLPHDVRVFEVRVGEGYGARWYLEPDEREDAGDDGGDGGGKGRKVVFRGFLEPAMEGGHEKGWRH